MNVLEQTLYKTRKSIRQAQIEIDFETSVITEIEECANCDIWWKKKEMNKDRGGNYICNFCFFNCGEYQ